MLWLEKFLIVFIKLQTQFMSAVINKLKKKTAFIVGEKFCLNVQYFKIELILRNKLDY